MRNSTDLQLIGNCSLRTLSIRGDQRGNLIALENEGEVPFTMQRIYYLYGTAPGTARGFHAHRALHQFAVCVSGSCTFLLDDGSERQDVVLDRPDVGLHIQPMVWHEMRDFSTDSVLLVMAAAPYDEADYIRSYEEFLSLVKQP